MYFPPSSGQHLRIGSDVERAVLVDDLLAGRVLDGLRHQIAQAADHRQHLQRVHDPFRHLRRHQLVDLPGEIVERLHAEREAHALVRAVDVAGDRDVVAGGPIEQQRRSAAGGLADAVGDGGDLEIGADGVADPREQLALLEVGEEVVEV